MHQSSSWCLWGPHLFATLSRMMPLFNAIEAQKIFWEFHISYVLIYEYIYIHICIHIYIHICSFVFPEACSASHIFLPCATKLLVTKMNSTPKNLLSWLFTIGSWVLYEAGPWWYTWWTQKLSLETRIRPCYSLIVISNWAWQRRFQFSLNTCLVLLSSLQYHNQTQQWLVFIFYKLKEGFCAKKLMCFMETDIMNLTTSA